MIDMTFECGAEGTCSDEVTVVVCLEITTAGSASSHHFRMTPEEARELVKVVQECLDNEVEEEEDADEVPDNYEGLTSFNSMGQHNHGKGD